MSTNYQDVRSLAAQQIRLARETIYGTPGTDWIVLDGLKMAPKGGPTTEMDYASGSFVPTMASVTEDMSEGTVTGKGDFNAAAIKMCSLFGLPAITSLGNGAYKWAWQWDGRTPVIPVPWTIDYGQGDMGSRFPGWVFSGFGFSGDQGEGFQVNAPGMGKKMSHIAPLGGITLASYTLTATSASAGTFTLTIDGAATATIPYNATAAAVKAAIEAVTGLGTVTVTGSSLPAGPLTIVFAGPKAGRPVTLTANSTGLTGGVATVTGVDIGADEAVAVPAIPINADTGKIWIDTTWAGAGTTQMLYIYQINVGLDDKYESVSPINRDLTSEFMIDREEQAHQFELGFGINPFERALLATIRAGGRSFLQVDWQGPLIGGGHHYRLLIKACLLWSEVGEPEGYRSTAMRNWTAMLARDSASDNCIEVEITTTLPSLTGV